MNIMEMSIDELKELSRKIALELNNRKMSCESARQEALSITDQYEFKFEAELRCEKPFVARCMYKNGKIELKFKNMPSSGNACSGKFTAFEGEILDIRGNEGRSYYTVYNGELLKMFDHSENMSVCRVMQYLKGDMTLDVLLEVTGVKAIDASVIDDLRDDD